MENDISYRERADRNGFKKSSLYFVKVALEKWLNNVGFSPNIKKSQIFSREMENALED